MARPKGVELQTVWKNFAKGLNTLVASNKIRPDELADATNIILTGEGFPTKRPGLDYYGDMLTSGQPILNTYGYYNSDGTSQFLALQNGLLKRKNANDSWSVVTGASFASGQLTAGVMTSNYLYLSNGISPLTRYDGSSMVVFSEISAPATTFLNLGGSLASGQYINSYRVSAYNSVGETLAAGAATIAVNTPRDLWNTNAESLVAGRTINVNWAKVSTARGYNIYGYINGVETLIDSVEGENVTTYADYGIRTPSQFFQVPASNTTGGPKGKFIIAFKGSLMIGGDPSNPSRLYFSAGADKPDNFSISDGGGWIDISKNSDDGKLIGGAVFQDSAILFKERSIHRFSFTEDVLPSLSLLKNDLGAVSFYAIQNVENDLFFLGRKPGGGAAIYVLGNEPNFLNVLRTNELSSRVRPELQTLTATNFERAGAVYYDGKYILFFTRGGDTKNNAALTYDRERLGFTQWRDVYADSSIVFYETNGTERFLIADNNDYSISEFSNIYTNDKGLPIEWSYRTRDEDFGNTLDKTRFNRIEMRLKDISGDVHFKVWTDTTDLVFDQIQSITSNNDDTAFGTGQFGDYSFGTNENEDIETNSESVIIRRILIKRLGAFSVANSMSFGLSGTELTSSATLLDLRLSGRLRSRNFYPREEEIF